MRGAPAKAAMMQDHNFIIGTCPVLRAGALYPRRERRGFTARRGNRYGVAQQGGPVCVSGISAPKKAKGPEPFGNRALSSQDAVKSRAPPWPTDRARA